MNYVKQRFSEIFPEYVADYEWALDEKATYDGPSLVNAKPSETEGLPFATSVPHYVMPIELALGVLAVLEKPRRNNIWLHGQSGTGKSDFVRELHARIKQPLWEINAHEAMTVGHLFGRQAVTQGTTHFVEGVIPRWLRRGGTLLINEFSTLRPDVTNALKSVLEERRYLSLSELGSERIEGHPSCRVIVTDNTQGRGDESGQYLNTNAQSIADMRRFSAFFEMQFMAAELEEKLLQSCAKAVSDRDMEEDQNDTTVSAETITKVVKVANNTRAAAKAGRISRQISTGDAINWVEMITMFPTVHKAARVAFLDGYARTDERAVFEMVSAEFGKEQPYVLQKKASNEPK